MLAISLDAKAAPMRTIPVMSTGSCSDVLDRGGIDETWLARTFQTSRRRFGRGRPYGAGGSLSAAAARADAALSADGLDDLHPATAPGRCLERVGEVVGLLDDLAVAELHDRNPAHRDAIAVIDGALQDPGVPRATHPPERGLWLGAGHRRIVLVHRLDIVQAGDAFPRLGPLLDDVR